MYQTIHRPAETVNRCQCCQQRVSLPNLEGSSDFFGNYNTPEVIHSSDNPCCGARHLPASTVLLVICRPLPLASSKHKIQCYISCKQEIPPVSWLFLSPQRPSPLRGPCFALPQAALPSLPCCFHFVYLLFAFVGGGALDAPQRHFQHRTTGCRGRQPLQQFYKLRC